MPVENGVGYSSESQEKEDFYRRLLYYHARITGHVIGRQRWLGYCYCLIDCNAGGGRLPGSGADGSPLVALRVFQDLKFGDGAHPPFRMLLVEHNAGNAEALRENFGRLYREMHFHPDCGYRIECRDNAEVVPELCRILGRDMTGLIYHDPTHLPDWNMLAVANSHAPRMDQLVWVNSIGIKRSRIHGKPTLLSGMQVTGKRRWLVSAPAEGRWQWAFVLGTNAPPSTFKDWKTIRWYLADSREGRTVLERMEFTDRERKEMGRAEQMEREARDEFTDSDSVEPA